jgi:hypothetical protein
MINILLFDFIRSIMKFNSIDRGSTFNFKLDSSLMGLILQQS